MRYLIFTAISLLATTGFAQNFSVGAEGGFYALTTDKVGVASFDKATCLMYGVTGTYYHSDRLSINTGISSGKFDIWNKGRYYRIPLAISYSLTKRGLLRIREYKNQSIGYILSLGFIPQSLEFEGGLVLGFYDGVYSHSSGKMELMIGSMDNEKPDRISYSITQQNARLVPGIEVGVRWGFEMGNTHLSFRPRYCLLLAKDNLVKIENLTTRQVTEGYSKDGFCMSVGLSYSF